MSDFNILKRTEAKQTFRVASIIGKFDLQSDIVEETFTGNLDLDSDWQIGVIVGASGTGKTTIAKELFADAYVTTFDYSASSIVDDMPSHCSVDEITKMFNSVGFSSPPSWLKPYSVLSNGQKMRVDLAKAMLSKNDLIVFDEFTSVVDRNVAKIGSYAVQKAIRKTDKKFIAVTCHNDVVDWILPDWIFNTDNMTFQKLEGQKKNRPKIKFEIFQAADKYVWKVFAKHHYLSHTHNNAAHVYVAYVNNQLAGFISVLHLPHPRAKNIKMVHRLVVLPDYQGVGIGVRLLEFIAKKYVKNEYRFKIVTSAPSLINYFKKSTYWKCNHFGRQSVGGTSGEMHNKNKENNSSSYKRITTSWEYDKK
jgi:ABC-type ATPase with predicted acetyltransferase domain